MLVDSHCHLNFKDFAEEGVEKIVNNAKNAGVDYMLSIATDYNELEDLTICISQFPNVFAAFGLHPEYAKTSRIPTIDELVKITSHKKFIGIGETGLDFSFEEAASLEEQGNLFRIHIAAARQSNVPVIIHSRNADKASLAILADEMKNGAFKAVLHCFTGSKEMAFAALDLGLYISVSGIITFGKSADDLRNTVKEVPLDRLLVETDAPFLAPNPKRGTRNEPAFVAYTAQKLAEIKKVSLSDIENITTANFFTLFDKAVQI